MIWLTKAWGWIKKYWKWLLPPLGVLIWILGRLTASKTVQVVAPELVGAEEVKEKANQQAKVDLGKAAAQKDAQVKVLEEKHSEAIASLTEGQKKQYEDIKNDPDAVNSFLTDVGKSIRGG